MQLMPETARRVAAEHGTAYDEKLLKRPGVNLDLGARYLAKMIRAFGGSLPVAVAAYNAGPRAVGKWVGRTPALEMDLWAALIPYEETRTYVVRVMSNLARYALLAGGEAAVPQIDISPPVGKSDPSDF
jgi:soluble lytic murein transglycosylase